ncbi:cell division protein ZipA [Aestuariibacter sp. AA17]|uniref:Cell division protein ZipA n=1 Tax=Fluctibacter corallii TaxID=2984329 RepID=A0ABT3A5K7_9ALTE|nr:cell division protein ZipA [Aestuariibacter sp. AA17]MCV2883903.1 cell division protein ZipA [Aestuariibacter sp. AA17]
MEELRLSFLVLGGIAIAAILIHGWWSIRKNASKDETGSRSARLEQDDAPIFTKSYEPHIEDEVIDVSSEQTSDLSDSRQHTAAQEFDELGIGEVRVVSRSQRDDVLDPDINKAKEPLTDTRDTLSAADESTVLEACEHQPSQEIDAEPTGAPKMYASVVTQPKPDFMTPKHGKTDNLSQAPDLPEPPISLLKQNSAEDNTRIEPDFRIDTFSVPDEELEAHADVVDAVSERHSFTEQAKNLVKRKKAETQNRKRREPSVREDQISIDFDEAEQKMRAGSGDDTLRTEDRGPDKPKRAPSEAETDVPQEVLVLNVKAAEDNPIQGAALLPMLLTLGFKFGDQDIFHRHVNSNGKGPVLFSLANMFKPGVFDIDNLENFTTQGVSLFMILPIEGDPHQVFNMMHNAARKLADEFSAQVLDGRRSVLTKQGLQQYVEKIREFERQRMIAR